MVRRGAVRRRQNNCKGRVCWDVAVNGGGRSNTGRMRRLMDPVPRHCGNIHDDAEPQGVTQGIRKAQELGRWRCQQYEMRPYCNE